MNSLSGDVLALEVAVTDGGGDLTKVEWLAVVPQDQVDLVADVLWVNGWPAC